MAFGDYTNEIPDTNDTDYPAKFNTFMTEVGDDVTSNKADIDGKAALIDSPSLNDLVSQESTGEMKKSGITPGGTNSGDMVSIDATQTLSAKTILAATNTLDPRVDDIAGITPTADQFVGGTGSALAMRTAAQVKTSLVITESDITDLGTTILENSDIGGSVQGYDVNTVFKNVANQYSATQNFDATEVTHSGTTYTLNFASNQVNIITMNANITSFNITAGSMKQGATYLIVFKQGTGGTIAWASNFKGDTTNTLSVTTGNWDLYSIVCVVDSSGSEVALLTHSLQDAG